MIGKSIGGGVPCGAYGLTNEVADQVMRRSASGEADIVDVGGVGGTLAGNPLSLAAIRATLGHVLTADAFDHMINVAGRYTADVQSVLDANDLPWSITQLGARAEYRFTRPAPRTGGESAAAADDQLDEFMHLYLINRGILITPFHNMALICPETTVADVSTHTEIFDAAVTELIAG